MVDGIYFIANPENPQNLDDQAILFEGIAVSAYSQRVLLRWIKKNKPRMLKDIMREKS
jgi:hypothetical protein